MCVFHQRGGEGPWKIEYHWEYSYVPYTARVLLRIHETVGTKTATSDFFSRCLMVRATLVSRVYINVLHVVLIKLNRYDVSHRQTCLWTIMMCQLYSRKGMEKRKNCGLLSNWEELCTFYCTFYMLTLFFCNTVVMYAVVFHLLKTVGKIYFLHLNIHIRE